MKPVQGIFYADNKPVRLTYVPDHGINAEIGAMVGGEFIPRREDQFAFVDHPELQSIYSMKRGSWNLRIIRAFLSDDGKPQETPEEIEEFNKWLLGL